MKLFQLYPKALAHLTCKSPLGPACFPRKWGDCAVPENRERRTERAGAKRQTFHGHGEQNAPAGRRVGFLGNRQGAKRRAAVAVSGEAAERPMEPEAVRAHCCVFAAHLFPRALLVAYIYKVGGKGGC